MRDFQCLVPIIRTLQQMKDTQYGTNTRYKRRDDCHVGHTPLSMSEYVVNDRFRKILLILKAVLMVEGNEYYHICFPMYYWPMSNLTMFNILVFLLSPFFKFAAVFF